MKIVEEVATDEYKMLRALVKGLDQDRMRLFEQLDRLEKGSVDADTVLATLEQLRLKQTELTEALRAAESMFLEGQKTDPALRERLGALAKEIAELKASTASVEEKLQHTNPDEVKLIASSVESMKLKQEQSLEELWYLDNVLLEMEKRGLGDELTKDLAAAVQELAPLKEMSSSLMAKQDEVATSVVAVIEELMTVKKDVKKNVNSLKRHVTSIQKASRDLVAQKAEYKAVKRELEKLNMRLGKVDNVEVLLKLVEARRKIATTKRTKLPQWAVETRARLEKGIETLEDEMLEVLIVNSLRRVKMNMVTLQQATGANREKLRKKVDRMLADGRIRQEKQGRLTVYSLA